MKNRELIEMLSKENWNAEVQINTGLPSYVADEIKSISSFTEKGKTIITLNTFE